MVVRFLATFVAMAVATLVVPGIALTDARLTTDVAALLGVAVIFGAVNAAVKPLFRRFGDFPTGLLVLGVALLAVNAVLLLITSAVCDVIGIPWRVAGPLAALLGALVVSVVSFLVNALFGRRGEEHQ